MIKQIGELRAAMLEDARAGLRSGPVRERVDLMFSYPYLKIRTLEDAGVAKRQTASHYLRTLSDAGILLTRKEGKEVYFINPQLLDLVAGERNEKDNGQRNRGATSIQSPAGRAYPNDHQLPIPPPPTTLRPARPDRTFTLT